MDDQRSQGPVLVGVNDPAQVQQLVRTAADLARLGAGEVRLVSVAVKPYDSPFGVFDDETIIEEYATESHELLERAETPPGVTVERDVVVGRTAANGLLDAVERVQPSALVVGWLRSGKGTSAVLGSTIDTLVERAPCDLYVERVGREANGVDSVLLPVAGGPHVEAGARLAAAIADANDARVSVFSVATPERGRQGASEAATAGREAVDRVPGVDPAVETTTVESSDVTEAILEVAPDHDVIVMGATEQGLIRRRLAGSVPRRVSERTDQTVILARDRRVVGGLGHWLGRLVR
jgi:nucleotide-binding universal stress UspA family protein